MKTIRLLVVTALALCAGTISSQAHGCGFGFRFGFSCLPLGIGFGLGTGWSCQSYGCYAYPSYSYAYAPAANYVSPLAEAPAVAVAPIDPPAPAWVPSTAGAGHWVPEAQPYCYTPVAPAKKADAVLAGQTVTTVQSPGGVRVYIVNR